MLLEWLMAFIKLKNAACVEGDAKGTKGAMRMLLQLLLLRKLRVLR